MGFLNSDGLSHLVQGIKAMLNKKVDKVEGKGLSTNDYTNEEKVKLSGLQNYVHPSVPGNKHIPSGGQTNQVLRWSADGTATWGEDKDTTYEVATQSQNGLMASSDKTKLDNIPTPSSIATQTYVAEQISAAGHITKSIVAKLPDPGEAKENVIYMVPKTEADDNSSYDEYMLIEGALEMIGNTKTVIDPIPNAEIDDLLNG